MPKETWWTSPKIGLIAILAVSLALRIWLIVQGGQYYWPDEQRYRTAQTAAERIVGGDIAGAAKELHTAEHFLFNVIALVPAIVEQVLGANSRIPASFFALFSVAGIPAVWIVARRLRMSEREALLAGLLLACSTTFVYYSRHLLPYDASLTLGLLALAVALRTPAAARDSWVCGFLCAASFLCYAGYWSLAAFVMLTHVLWQDARAAASRALQVGAAFAVPIGVLLGLSMLAGGGIFHQFISFSATVTQGNFDEGWSLPFAYLWHAEHGLSVLWLLGIVFAVHGAATRRNPTNVPLVAVLFLYGMLVIASVGFERFVVYGRTAKQLVPFLCLVSAGQVSWLLHGWPRARHALAVATALVIVQAGLNLSTPLSQVFPAEFRDRARTSAAVSGEAHVDYLFVDHIYPLPEPVVQTNGRIILEEPHPIEFLPYQYEGYTRHQRAILRSTDIRMRAVVRDVREAR